ncbi:MAG: hypothetical protein DRQ47_02455 [Gammaproteobacteria bacterium]|nr:MAG: hypothetical protein DRQ47_02455 [Gammaproteobacteria bacterium]
MEVNASSSGIQTFLNASQQVQESAAQIAKSTANGSLEGTTEAIVDLKVAEQQAQAATKIIEAEGNQIGSLLDTLA